MPLLVNTHAALVPGYNHIYWTRRTRLILFCCGSCMLPSPHTHDSKHKAAFHRIRLKKPPQVSVKFPQTRNPNPMWKLKLSWSGVFFSRNNTRYSFIGVLFLNRRQSSPSVFTCAMMKYLQLLFYWTYFSVFISHRQNSSFWGDLEIHIIKI